MGLYISAVLVYAVAYILVRMSRLAQQLHWPEVGCVGQLCLQ